MNKTWLTALAFVCTATTASSQTLFTYGSNSADAKEFIRAFSKNNQEPASKKSAAMKEYLDLYINSRLKIQEAYARGYDTLPQIKNEVDNLRAQIIETYLSDPDAINRLTKEAFQRSQKDIHLAHIFISFNDATNMLDTAAAIKKLNEVKARLAKGEDFKAVATKFSDDPSAATNHGDLDYITVFTLPYELENIVYNTPVGKYSAPHASKAGWHIFKNLGERKALGKIKVQQILLAFPPNVDAATKKSIANRADSIYQQLIKGGDFAALASTFSNDVVSASAQGNIPEISVGQYDPVFENAIWSLAKDGAVSKPILTSHGYHIVKRVSITPVVTNPADKPNTNDLEQKVKNDDRWKTARDFIYAQIKNKAGYTKAKYNDFYLYAYSDSVLNGRTAGPNGRNTLPTDLLFTIGKKNYTVADWIAYGQGFRYKSDRSGLKSYPDLMDEFVKYSMYAYYRDNLEQFNDEFRTQMMEFKDGNLFFEIMQREVWNKAQNDSTALQGLYEQHKNDYDWKQSADAAIFFCSDETVAKTLMDQLKKDAGNWRKEVDKLNERVVADSSRYEWSQLPGLTGTPRAGQLTPVTVNKADNTASFAYILKVYTQPSHRSFEEAKGLVMNDYQTVLEQEWIKELRKKYPVTVDQKTFAAISK